jgi:glyoxylase-like metal-dependent hydrolase (beta-lactamase superfamily II)
VGWAIHLKVADEEGNRIEASGRRTRLLPGLLRYPLPGSGAGARCLASSSTPTGVGWRAIDEVAQADGVSNKVTYLVHTHHHADHAGASSLFGKDVVRIGHEETRRLLLRDDDPNRPAPEETFSDRRTLENLASQVGRRTSVPPSSQAWRSLSARPPRVRTCPERRRLVWRGPGLREASARP